MFVGEISSFVGQRNSLRGLNLSHNSFSGQIPESIGNLTLLEWLDLSSNKLNGQIPHKLADLTFLAFLNLSDNRLTGPIPQGRQFNTFENASYHGNIGLCGFPLARGCNADGGTSTKRHMIAADCNKFCPERYVDRVRMWVASWSCYWICCCQNR